MAEDNNPVKGDDSKELLLFQLGPVQEFIAQAETIGDLRAGSEILSELTAAALATIPGYWENAVFPAVEKDALKGIPNRFLVRVERGKGEALARAAAEAARKWLKDVIAAPVREKSTGKEAFDEQIKAFLQTTWAVLKKPTGDMGADYKTIGKLMAMRRNVRAFGAWPEEASGQVKDFLTGKEAALDVKDSSSPNRNSGRGAMNLIKLWRTTDADKLKSAKLGSYIAVLSMDGDHMGAKLSGFKTSEEHRVFSGKLAEYATNVKINDDDGILVYAGGDDVLAVVKATCAIDIARDLATQFAAALNDPGKHEITASVGIAIGSAKAPLQDLIQESRAAEGRAKHVYGRDALAVSVLKRSGEILHWGCKWDSAALRLYGDLAKHKGKFSRFAYKLAGFLEPYDLGARGGEGKLLVNWAEMKDVVRQETLHSIEQTEGMNGVLSKEDIDGYLREVSEHPEDFLGLFLCETFISRPRD